MALKSVLGNCHAGVNIIDRGAGQLGRALHNSPEVEPAAQEERSSEIVEVELSR